MNDNNNKKRKVVESIDILSDVSATSTPSPTFGSLQSNRSINSIPKINLENREMQNSLSTLLSRTNANDADRDSDEDEDGNDPTICALNLSFSDWIDLKRGKAHRKRFILTSEEYNDIIHVLNNESILKGRQDLKWILPLKVKRRLSVLKVPNPDLLIKGNIDILISTKKHRLIANELPYTRVVHINNIENVIVTSHIAASHGGISKTFKFLQKTYSMVPRSAVAAYIATCQRCIELRDNKKKARLPLNPIISKGTFDHIVIDLIDYSHKPAGPQNQYHYVVHAVDHFSTFHFTDEIKEKTAFNVLRFLQRLFSIIGYPCVLHSDNGSEFKNQLVDSYLQKHNIEHRRGKPRRPTTQGKVERANRTLKRAIRQLIKEGENKLTWFDVLFDATVSLNITHSTLINKSPYVHVYHQETPKNEFKIEVVEDESSDCYESKSDTDDSENDESPIPTQEQLYDAMVASINQDSEVNYHKNIDRMKKSYDKRFAPIIRCIGDILALRLPEDIVVRGESNKLPAVVIGNKVMDNNYYYILGYKGKVIKGLFAGADLESINRVTFGPLIGILLDELDDYTMYARYGLKRNGFDYNFISLREAYEDYNPIFNPLPNQSSSQDAEFQCCELNGNPNASNDSMDIDIDASSTSNKSPSSSAIPENIICHICDILISSPGTPNQCFRCKNYYHIQTECRFWQCHLIDGNNTYCSMKCLTNVQVYEVEIVGETSKYFKVRWNNGAETKKTKAKMLKVAEYTKIIKLWQDQHPVTSIDLTESLSTNSVLPQPVPKSNSPISNERQNRVCCVCLKTLDDTNIHCCYSCKRPMHGDIICAKRNLIFHDEDDNLHCPVCHPPT